MILAGFGGNIVIIDRDIPAALRRVGDGIGLEDTVILIHIDEIANRAGDGVDRQRAGGIVRVHIVKDTVDVRGITAADLPADEHRAGFQRAAGVIDRPIGQSCARFLVNILRADQSRAVHEIDLERRDISVDRIHLCEGAERQQREDHDETEHEA